jgi:hypothetical protein
MYNARLIEIYVRLMTATSRAARYSQWKIPKSHTHSVQIGPTMRTKVSALKHFFMA